MEDRVRALETELNAFKTTLNTSKWWLVILGALLLGQFSLTSFYSVPNAVDQKFVNEGGEGIIEKLTASEKSAAASARILEEAAGAIGDFEPIQMYQCPYNTKDVKPSISGGWASFGCLGQYSSRATCSNLSWVGSVATVSIECVPVTLFKKK